MLELAKEQAQSESEIQDEEELSKLKKFYGSMGSKLATGGNKAIKELEKEQKARNTRLIRDNLDRALLDLATFYKDLLLIQSNSVVQITNKDLQNKLKIKAEETSIEITIDSINAIIRSRNSLIKNSAPNLTTEALFQSLKVG